MSFPNLTTDQFIEKAKETHGENYDYSQVNYVNRKTKVVIVCLKHGKFEQLTHNHIKGKGCPKCGLVKLSANKTLNTYSFIDKAKQKHGDKYDYSQVNYTNSHTDVSIICHEHGIFSQSPTNHLTGRGCSKCGDISCAKLQRSNTDEFVEKAIKVHGKLYDYSFVNYVNRNIEVIISCPIHGKFPQTPCNHLYGKGCPVCKSSKGERLIRSILEKHNISFIQEYIIPNSNSCYRYDFYLPDYNLVIEFHGKQHYEAVEFFGGAEGLRVTIIRDNIKKEMAKYFHMKYLCIKYTVLDSFGESRFEQSLLKNLTQFKKVTL